MKKLMVVVGLLCVTAGVLQAQFEPGIKGGVNITDITHFNGDNRVSGHVGLFLHKTLNARWCIQPEVLYSWQGQKFQTAAGERTLALNYVQIPVMVQYFPVKQVYLEAGPQLGILTSAKVKNDDSKTEVDDNYTRADVGINVGVGVAATRQLGFYARYMAGLTDISKNDDRTHSNRGAQIGAYIRLR